MHRTTTKRLQMILVAMVVGIGPALLAMPAQANPDIVYVDKDASGSNDGTSWENAYNSLHDALDDAASGDEIWVAEGTYKPSAWPNDGSPDSRKMHFSLKNGVEVYGGFDGTETQRNQRDWHSNRTILSGDIGNEGDSSDNCYHVFYHLKATELNETAVLDGFTIAAGNATGSLNHDDGGGMHNRGGSSPTLANCSFRGNSAGDLGGGLYNIGSSPTLINCTFCGNRATGAGGAMCNARGQGGSKPNLINCTFSGNRAGEGGALYNSYSDPMLTNCILWGDRAESHHEVRNFWSTPILSYCDIEGSGGSASWDTLLGNDGGHNIDSDPLLVGPPDPTTAPTTAGDLHLQAGSPCIDSGNNTAAAVVSTDFEEDPRIIDGDKDGQAIVDMGADEFLPESSPVGVVGGEAYSVSTTGVLAPWIGLIALIAGSVRIYAFRRRKSHN